MIVKNESQIIERCLKSIQNHIDIISICDTGSTDDTVEIIERFLEESGIPGKVHRHTWKNFGHNRTLSANAAKKTIEEFGFSLSNTYLLLIDADMLLKVNPDFNKNDLKEDVYLILQKSWMHSLYNTRLLRASIPWRCVGVTHEYWTSNRLLREARLNTLSIDDRDDGGCKSDKFERDVQLLLQGLETETENERYFFYLALSYKALKQYDDAIKYFKARIDKQGWYEEVWYSKYMIGLCYEEMDQWEQALSWYLDAYQYNRDRAEPLQQISSYYRMNGQHNLAYFFAEQGSRIPFPEKQTLFISHRVYDYLFDEDISVSAFYTPYKEEGYAANNRLLLKKSVPQFIKEQAYKNIQFYLPTLEATFQPIKFDLPLIRDGYPAHYNPMNPSIIKTNDGYDVLCRTVNYMQIAAKHFKSLDWFDTSNTLRTRNFLLHYDQNFNLLSQQEIVEFLPRYRRYFYNIEGLEDCRLFQFNNSTWFSCNTRETNPCGQPQVSLGKLSDDRTNATIHVEKLIPLLGPDPTQCEKNWLPFVKDGEIHLIYSYDPYIFYKPTLDDAGRVLQVTNFYQTSSHDFSHFLGSAPPIEFDEGYLLLIHEVVYVNEQRSYTERFVYLDKDYNIQKVSKPFIFLHKGIEYCCGITIDHSYTNLILTVGLEDREAYFCFVSLETVRSMLEPLP